MELERALAAEWPESAWRDVHVVLAVSGGADSVALLRAMVALKAKCGGAGEILVAHLNHGLRGSEANADAAWVAALCNQFGVKCEQGLADVASAAERQGDGWESAARNARYEFLLRTAERIGARFVATAHNADDQVETVLHRILRGTGLAGLAGIPKTRALSPSVALMRPLLGVHRAEVLAYLSALGQDFRTDSSNEDQRFTRNVLRHTLLPQLREQFNSDVDGALARLARQAGEAQQLVGALAENLLQSCVAIEFDGASHKLNRAATIRIDCSPLVAVEAIVVREVCRLAWRAASWPLQSMGFEEWCVLAGLVADSGPHALNLPGDIQALRAEGHVTLRAPSLA